jgi:hypothetical protein
MKPNMEVSIKRNWIKFKTETGLECGYWKNPETGNYVIKIYSKVPRMHYHSALNEAGLYFEYHILQTIETD